MAVTCSALMAEYDTGEGGDRKLGGTKQELTADAVEAVARSERVPGRSIRRRRLAGPARRRRRGWRAPGSQGRFLWHGEEDDIEECVGHVGWFKELSGRACSRWRAPVRSGGDDNGGGEKGRS